MNRGLWAPITKHIQFLEPPGKAFNMILFLSANPSDALTLTCSPTTNDCNLYNFGFYAPDYTNLQSLSFTLEPYDTSLGKITVYVDDMTYTVTSA